MDPSAQPAQSDLRNQFIQMSIVFAIGHGTATTPLVYASSLLDTQVAYLCNGILYIFMLISSLVCAVPVVGSIGLRGGLVTSLAFYAVYVSAFSLATMFSTPSMQSAFFIPGSVCGGLAAGLLWTAQGGYLAHCGTTIAEEENTPRELVVSQLQGWFAFYYLLLEVISKVLWSILMVAGLSAQGTGLAFVVIACGSAIAMTYVGDVQNAQVKMTAAAKLLAVVNLWKDPRIWLLSPTNITFGVAAAYMNGHFNATIASKVLGKQYIGYLSALTVTAAWAFTCLYSGLGQRFGNIVPITIGALSFAAIAALMLWTSVDHYGWWLAVFYVLQGSGRSVFENANKAVFAETFKGPATEGAFANGVLQLGVASAACFWLSDVSAGWQLAVAILVFSALMPTLYMVKCSLNLPEGSEDDPLLEKSA